MKLLKIPLALGVLLLVFALLAAPAGAATCGFSGSTVTVTFAANDSVTMAVARHSRDHGRRELRCGDDEHG
jgi:hypothetical protein